MGIGTETPAAPAGDPRPAGGSKAARQNKDERRRNRGGSPREVLLGSCSTGGCATGGGGLNFEAGRLYVGIRSAGAEDGREQLCFTGINRHTKGTKLVVDSERGLEFAEVINERPLIFKACQTKGARKFVRLASEEDQETLKRKTAKEREAFQLCMTKSRERNLEMKLIRAEYDWEVKKIQITYTSEGRIDFRDLVRDLARLLSSRIEMRQIGVRDGTRVTGGIGPCGLTLCCSTFLHDFHPVTIKMAKNQNLSLNPSKISGQCGRLMCCLAYENDVYVERKSRGDVPKPAPALPAENGELPPA